MWTRALLFSRFTDTDVYRTGSVNRWKTRDTISIDVHLFFTNAYWHLERGMHHRVIIIVHFDKREWEREVYLCKTHVKLKKQEAFEKCWAHSPQRAASRQFTRCRHCTVARRLHIDVHDADDNAWQRGPLWPHGMGPIRQLHQSHGTYINNQK